MISFILLLFSLLHFGNGLLENDACSSREPTSVILQVRGRLGNHVWSYMKGIALELKYGIAFHLTQDSINILQPFFPNLKIREAEQDFYAFYNQFMEVINSKIHDHYRNVSGNDSLIIKYNSEAQTWVIPAELDKLNHLNVFEIVNTPEFENEIRRETETKWELFREPIHRLGSHDWRRGRFLYLPAGISRKGDSDLFMKIKLEETIAEHLRLKDEYLQYANMKLESVKKALGERKNVIYVGIHSRRSDYIDFQSKIGLKPLRNDYYYKAIRLFRQRFEKSKKSKKTVIAFIFVSDDMEYGRNVLLPKEKNVFFLGNGLINSVKGIGMDLGLLASCNHTILSYGSFSYFAGFLSGGVKIIPEHFGEYRTKTNQHLKSLDKNPFDNPLPRLHFFDQMT